MYLYIYLNKKGQFKYRVCKKYYGGKVKGQSSNAYEHILLEVLYYDEKKQKFEFMEEKIKKEKKYYKIYQKIYEIKKRIRKFFTYKVLFIIMMIINVIVLILLGINR